jgi:hypothetical protein
MNCFVSFYMTCDIINKYGCLINTWLATLCIVNVEIGCILTLNVAHQNLNTAASTYKPMQIITIAPELAEPRRASSPGPPIRRPGDEATMYPDPSSLVSPYPDPNSKEGAVGSGCVTISSRAWWGLGRDYIHVHARQYWRHC